MEHVEYSLVLEQGALNDDTLYKIEKGWHYGNNPRNKFCVVYWTYANEWCNHQHHFYAQSIEAAIERYIRMAKPDKEKRRELRKLAYEYA